MKKITLLITMLAIYYGALFAKTLPGDTSLSSSQEELQKIIKEANENIYKYKVKDFFKKPLLSNFSISRNGKYYAYFKREADGFQSIYMKEIKTFKETKLIDANHSTISGFSWLNDDTLLYTKDNQGDENNKIFSYNIVNKKLTNLTPFGNQVGSFMLNILVEDDDHIIISTNKDNPQFFKPYKVNVNSGVLTSIVRKNLEHLPITEYIFDYHGNLRAYWLKEKDGLHQTLFYKNNNKFKKVLTLHWKDSFSIVTFDENSAYPHDILVATNLYSDTSQVIRYDIKRNKIMDKLFSHKEFDIGSLGISAKKRKFEIDYYGYNGAKMTIIPISEKYKTLYEKFKILVPYKEATLEIVDHDRKEERYIVYVSSDKIPGIYYYYNDLENSFQKIYQIKANLKKDDLVDVSPIKFNSRDGLTLNGYFTMPKPKVKQPPLIVIPHGGPYLVRDNWEWSNWTGIIQLLASRGYAVLQINFRGSGGYGKDFYLAGKNQVGRKMIDDLEDGVSYIKSLKLIDPKRIAIFGASYGGLATLQSLIRSSKIYKCGIDYVGVSNLFTFMESIPPYWEPLRIQTYDLWYDPNIPEQKAIMKKVSPALNIKDLNKPLLVVQGANDPRVNINESDQIVKQLRDKGVNVPYVVKYDEGHGFSREENNLELFKIILGFLNKNL